MKHISLILILALMICSCGTEKSPKSPAMKVTIEIAEVNEGVLRCWITPETDAIGQGHWLRSYEFITDKELDWQCLGFMGANYTGGPLRNACNIEIEKIKPNHTHIAVIHELYEGRDKSSDPILRKVDFAPLPRGLNANDK